jgi:ankyrin repeat protein
MNSVLVTIALMLAPAIGYAAGDPVNVVDAARRGDAALVQKMIAARADVNATSPDGTTALHWAAEHGDVELVRFLIARGANVRTANRYGVTALRSACEQGSAAVVETLVAAGADVNATRAESGDTPVMIAARSGHGDVVSILIARGANVDAIEPVRGQTALMWAAAERHPAAVKVLLDAGANANAVSKTKMTALMFAVRAGDVESARLLLDRGVDVNQRGAGGTSMLVLAILNARFDAAKLLLERGADPNVNDPHGMPLHVLAFLRRAGNFALANYLPRQLPQSGMDSFALTNELLAHGADINARYPNAGAPQHLALSGFRVPFLGATPFFIASITADVPYMRFLAEHGADPTIPTAANITPLLGASGIGTFVGETPATKLEAFEAVKLAYELGNDPKATIAPSTARLDKRYVGATAIHGAAYLGATDMVQWLVGKGVPLETKSALGINAYQIAAAIDGFVFIPWPETAAAILKLANEGGVAIDTAPAKVTLGYAREQ